MNIKKYIGLALLPMVFTACQEDTLVNDQAQGIYTLKATMDKTASASRAQIVLGGTSTTSETFHWNKGDEMSVFEYEDAKSAIVEHSFHISETYDGKSASAEFTTTNALTEGMNFTALYPATSLNDGKLKLEMQGLYTLNDYSQSSWVDYLSNNMYMLATGSVEENMSLEMEHLCSLLRVTYTNSTDEEVKIYSVAAHGHLCGYRTFSVTNVSEKASDDSRYDRIGVSFKDGMTVASGESKDFYILVFSYFDEKNYSWNGLNGFTVACPNNEYLSTPTTYNGKDFLLPDLNPGKAYWFNITQTTEGLVWTKDVNQGEEDDVTVTFSNTELAAALYSVLGTDLVTMNPDGTAVMKQSDVLAVKELDFGWNAYTITSLSGIEKFVNLEFLRCCQTGLATCDLSQNTSLKDVQIYGSLLQSLDVTNLTELERLNCAGITELEELDLSNCKKLGSLDCSQTALDVINIPVPENMWRLCYGGNKDLQVDLSLYPNLTILGIYGMGLTTLNIPQSIQSKLVALYVSNNNLTTIDLTAYPNLENLECGINNLTSLDLSVVPDLRTLFCDRNKIPTLDITALSHLEELHCGDQQDNINLSLTMTEDQKETWDNTWSVQNHSVSVQVAGATQVITFTNKELSKALYAVLGAEKVSFNADSCALMSSVDVKAVTSLNFSWKDFTITSLEGIENFVNLDVLQCSSVGLKSCDLSKNPKIFYLDLSWNDLSSLDLSNQSGLQNLNCSFNDRLADLTLPITKDLYHLSVENTALESLDIYYPASISVLYYGNTKVTPFDMSEFINLKLLDVDNLGLNNLDLIPSTIKAQLETFYCDDNNLSELDLSQFPVLRDLHCNNNDIKALDLKSAPNLRSLMCIGNQIDSLDISHWESIDYIACGSQQDDKILNLTMTEDQKKVWDENWSHGENEKVNAIITNAGGGTAEAE